MSELTYDPRAKEVVKEQLVALLYDPVKAHYRARLESIIRRNTLKAGNGQTFFSYRGVTYALDPSERLPRQINRLHPSLREEMDRYLEEVTRLNDTELPYVINFINALLNASGSLKDYLEILPEVVHKPLKQLMTQCPCQRGELTPETRHDLLVRHQKSIELIRQRMVLNLIA